MQADDEEAVLEHDIDLVFADERLMALIETIRAPAYLFIENVAVAPEQQGRGWGRQLLTHSEQKARPAGFGALDLLTNAALETNVGLYHAPGYRIAREELFLDGTTVHMSKVLAP